MVKGHRRDRGSKREGDKTETEKKDRKDRSGREDKTEMRDREDKTEIEKDKREDER